MNMNLIAWDPIDKKMGVVDTYHPKTGKVMFENDSWDWYKRDRIVRRPTGLKDKNDVPIYEGDFVQETVIGLGLGKVGHDENFGAWTIEWQGNSISWLGHYYASLSIIGNIYANPELLEGGQA